MSNASELTEKAGPRKVPFNQQPRSFQVNACIAFTIAGVLRAFRVLRHSVVSTAQ